MSQDEFRGMLPGQAEFTLPRPAEPVRVDGDSMAPALRSGDVVLVTRAELDGLQDRLYQLRCALEDAQTLLTEKPTKAELERQLAELVRSTGRLDRLWVSERSGG